MRSDLQSTGFDPFNAVGNPGRPQRFDVDCRHGFSTHSTCAIAAADQMANIDLFSTPKFYLFAPIVALQLPPSQACLFHMCRGLLRSAIGIDALAI